MIAIFQLMSLGLNLLVWAIIIRALISWVQPDPYNPIVRFLDRVTEPIMRPIRQLLPNTMGIDFSPLVAILLIQLVQRTVLPNLMQALH